MRIKVLASGSKGNSVYVESKNAKILIDAGINYNKIKKELDEIDVNIEHLDGIIISHAHSDHMLGLKSIQKKQDTKVFIKKELQKEIKEVIKEENINIIEGNFKINDLYIEVLNVSHDVPNSGFIVNENNNSLVYITDTGYINKKNFELTKNKTVYIIEANHNEKMLMEGKYPYMLKQRVLSDEGHLSNSYTGRYLRKTLGDNTKYIILAHLSENNNTKELALSEVKEEIKCTNFNEDNLTVAYQNGGNELICVW